MTNLYNMEENIKDALGANEMLDAVLMALDYDTEKEILEYIARTYDIDPIDPEEED